MSDLVTVEIGGLPVEVDAKEWSCNLEIVLSEVRRQREELRLPPLEGSPDPSYTDLYGDDA